ncbi:MAG: GDSL-type esterase/lipase family protein [Pirellulaceae bacterium]
MSDKTQRPGRIARWAMLLAALVAVIASLLTFPAAIAWMVGGWLVWHTCRVLRGRPSWALAVCSVVLLIKRVPWSWSLLALAVAAALALASTAWSIRRRPTAQRDPKPMEWQSRLTWATLVLLWLSWGYFAWDFDDAASASRRPPFDPSRPVVCLGDSLTAGGYPTLLAERLSVPVVDMGVEGNTTRDAIAQAPALAALQPQVVVVEIGGNDYVQGATRDETRDNLQHIVNVCRNAGAEVVLVEIPRGFVADPYGGLEREIARRDDLELIPDTTIRWFVLRSPYAPPGMWLHREWHLSDDGLHPNARGSEALADRVADALATMYGPEIRKSSRDGDGATLDDGIPINRLPAKRPARLSRHGLCAAVRASP